MSQCGALLERLLAGATITPRLAYDLTGSLACHSRIAELRSRGYRIECTIVSDGTRRWGEYRLVQPEQIPLFNGAGLGVEFPSQKDEGPR